MVCTHAKYISDDKCMLIIDTLTEHYCLPNVSFSSSSIFHKPKRETCKVGRNSSFLFIYLFKLLLRGTSMSHGFRALDLPLNRDEITDVDIKLEAMQGQCQIQRSCWYCRLLTHTVYTVTYT